MTQSVRQEHGTSRISSKSGRSRRCTGGSSQHRAFVVQITPFLDEKHLLFYTDCGGIYETRRPRWLPLCAFLPTKYIVKEYAHEAWCETCKQYLPCCQHGIVSCSIFLYSACHFTCTCNKSSRYREHSKQSIFWTSGSNNHSRWFGLV